MIFIDGVFISAVKTESSNVNFPGRVTLTCVWQLSAEKIHLIITMYKLTDTEEDSETWDSEMP